MGNGGKVPVLLTWLDLVWHLAVPDDKNDSFQETKYQSITNCTWHSNLSVSKSYHHGRDSKTLPRCVYMRHTCTVQTGKQRTTTFLRSHFCICFTPTFGISFVYCITDSPPKSAEVKKCGSKHPLPYKPSWRCTYLVKYKDNFIFTFYVVLKWLLPDLFKERYQLTRLYNFEY